MTKSLYSWKLENAIAVIQLNILESDQEAKALIRI